MTVVLTATLALAPVAGAATAPSTAVGSAAASRPPALGQAASSSGGSLEAAASKASQVGRKVAMSLIGVGLAIAGVMLVFRRRFKDAAGVFAVGFTAVLLVSPAGVNVLRGTVSLLFGA